MAGLHTRWFKWRFSLRTALVAILLLSLFLAWYAYKRRGLVAQAALVRDIRRCGGEVGGNLYGPQETRWRQFLLLSEDDFGNVVSVNLDDVQGVDAILPRLALFPQLKYLHLSGSDVTDEGLARLGGCQRVESLWLQRTKNLTGGRPELPCPHADRYGSGSLPIANRLRRDRANCFGEPEVP